MVAIDRFDKKTFHLFSNNSSYESYHNQTSGKPFYGEMTLCKSLDTLSELCKPKKVPQLPIVTLSNSCAPMGLCEAVAVV